jgi:hypothetical protein
VDTSGAKVVASFGAAATTTMTGPVGTTTRWDVQAEASRRALTAAAADRLTTRTGRTDDLVATLDPGARAVGQQLALRPAPG